MSNAVEYVLEQRAKKDAAIRRALKAYPDVYFERDYLVSPSLKGEDCNTMITVEYGERIRIGKCFDGVMVLTEGRVSGTVDSFLWRLKDQEPALYSALVQAIARNP
jgi:hypothetical protein